jgi:uncharacterized protein YneF (UPF0154 family)
MHCQNDFNDWFSSVVMSILITTCSILGFFSSKKNLKERLKNNEINEQLLKYRKFLKDGRDKGV